MRNHSKLIVAAALLALVTTSGCAAIFGRAGVETREHVLLPAIEQAWPGVHVDVIHGNPPVEVLVRADEWDLADSVSEFLALRTRDWADLQFYAYQGIAVRADSGVIGPIVAGELRERVDRLDEALASLAGEPTEPDAE